MSCFLDHCVLGGAAMLDIDKLYTAKKGPTEASDHYKSAFLWASLVLPQPKYRKSDFFFFRAKGK